MPAIAALAALNAVRIRDRLALIDLDSSSRLGPAPGVDQPVGFAATKFSSGCVSVGEERVKISSL